MPILNAYDNGHNLCVRCWYCERWHFHGMPGGDRVAHCIYRSSPYTRTGYFLQCVGTVPAAVTRAKAGKIHERWCERADALLAIVERSPRPVPLTHLHPGDIGFGRWTKAHVEQAARRLVEAGWCVETTIYLQGEEEVE